jgi:hypothetical protein
MLYKEEKKPTFNYIKVKEMHVFVRWSMENVP